MSSKWAQGCILMTVNCNKGATTENQGSGVKYMGSGLYLDDCVCVCVCVIWLDMTTPHLWREKVVVYYKIDFPEGGGLRMFLAEKRAAGQLSLRNTGTLTRQI